MEDMNYPFETYVILGKKGRRTSKWNPYSPVTRLKIDPAVNAFQVTEVATIFTDDCYICKTPYHWMCLVLSQILEPCSSSWCHHVPPCQIDCGEIPKLANSREAKPSVVQVAHWLSTSGIPLARTDQGWVKGCKNASLWVEYLEKLPPKNGDYCQGLYWTNIFFSKTHLESWPIPPQHFFRKAASDMEIRQEKFGGLRDGYYIQGSNEGDPGHHQWHVPYANQIWLYIHDTWCMLHEDIHISYIYMYTLRTYNMIYVYLSINGVMGGYMSICLSSLNLNIRLNLIWTNLI